jgi:NitT/TauT family transport system permease protein
MVEEDAVSGVGTMRGGRSSVRHASLSVLSIGVLLGGWFAVSYFGAMPKMILPSPWDVVVAFERSLFTPFAGATLSQHLIASLGRFFSGFLLAVALGIPTGLLMGWFAPFRYAIAPFFETFRFIAPLAWVPFAALWFGTGIGGPVLIVFSGAFAAAVINTFRGTQMTDPCIIEACRTMGAGGWRLMTDVLLPSATPSIMSGIRIAAALGWQSLIGAELIVASSGVGYLIVQGQGSVETPIVMAGMATIGCVGLLIDGVLRLAERKLTRNWRAE